MPELAEAQALLAALGGDVRRSRPQSAQRERRLHLQTAYGQAMMWAKGFAAEETKAAFARASELAANTDNFAARFATGHSQWASAMVRGEQRRARVLASSFLKEAEDAGRLVEVGVARRGLAQACYLSGEFLEARTHCERALDACDPEREKETRERFTDDTGPIAISLLAMTMWQLGEVERARELIDEANRRARDLGHAPSMAHPLNWKSRLEILRGDAAAALSAAETLEGLCREHGMPFWRIRADLDAEWARGRLHDGAAGVEGLRRALAAAVGQGMMWDAWFYTALLAELEAEDTGRGQRAQANRRSVGPRPPGRRSLRSRLPPSSARRTVAEARSVQSSLLGGSLSNCARHCEGARRAQLGSSSGALARQALSIDRPPRRRPRRSRARPRRLCADARNAGDRGGAGAVGGYRGRRACEARINTAIWLSCYSE